MVLRRARLLLRDDHAARDALHDVFLRVLRAEREFRAQSTPATWLYRIVTNHCLKAPQGVESYELGATVAGLRVVDRGRWSVAAGLELGPVWRIDSKPGNTPGTTAFAGLVGLVGAVGQLQRSLSARSYARLELGALGYWNADDGSGEAGVAVRFSWSVNAGLGAYF
jgi:hypothetical protein